MPTAHPATISQARGRSMIAQHLDGASSKMIDHPDELWACLEAATRGSENEFSPHLPKFRTEFADFPKKTINTNRKSLRRAEKRRAANFKATPLIVRRVSL
jgi:rubrerythrin